MCKKKNALKLHLPLLKLWLGPGDGGQVSISLAYLPHHVPFSLLLSAALAYRTESKAEHSKWLSLTQNVPVIRPVAC